MAGSVAMGAKVGGAVEFGLGHNASEKYSSSRDGQERRRKRKKKGEVDWFIRVWDP